MELNILFEDKHVIVLEKPAGIASQGSRSFDIDLCDEIKGYLAGQNNSREEPELYVVHRLDRPVGGLMVYAKTKQAARELSAQISRKAIAKYYYAVLTGVPEKQEGVLSDYLLKDGRSNTSKVVGEKTAGARKAELSFRILESCADEGKLFSLAEVDLHTGRHHQIRVQFANMGYPLYGDTKYNEAYQNQKEKKVWCNIGLYACRLEFLHPVTGRVMEYSLKPQQGIFQKFTFG